MIHTSGYAFSAYFHPLIMSVNGLPPQSSAIASVNSGTGDTSIYITGASEMRQTLSKCSASCWVYHNHKVTLLGKD
jgi:hypothetical protein